MTAMRKVGERAIEREEATNVAAVIPVKATAEGAAATETRMVAM